MIQITALLQTKNESQRHYNNFFIISSNEKDDELLIENGTLTTDFPPLKQRFIHRKP